MILYLCELQMKAEVNSEKLQQASKSSWGPVDLSKLKEFSSWLLGKEIPEIPLGCYVLHGCIHKSSYDRAMNEVLQEAEVQERVLAEYVRQGAKVQARQVQCSSECYLHAAGICQNQ